MWELGNASPFCGGVAQLGISSPGTMSRRLLNHATSLLLSAILLTAALVPPGTRHHHEVAEGRLTGHQHHGSETIHHPHSHGDQEAPLPAVKGGLWHLHFELLGIEVTLPDSRPPQDDDERDVLDPQFVSATGDLPLRTASNHGLFTGLLCGLSMVTVGSRPLPCPSMPTPPVTSPPLCDSARFERSGVLLT